MKKLLLICLMLTAGLMTRAALLHYSNRIYTPYLGSPVVIGTPYANVLTEVNPKTGAFTDLTARNRITFGVDEFYQSYFGSAMLVHIKTTVKRWDQNLTALPDTIVELELNYNPFGPGAYIDMQSANFRDAYKIELTLEEVTVNGVMENTLPANLFIDAEIFIERYEQFTSAAQPIPFLNAANAQIDEDCDGHNDAYRIAWQTIPGVEEYQLEWLHINDYNFTAGTNMAPEYLEYDFQFNSTRIATTNTYYDLSLVFEKGFLIYRVRGVGRNASDLDQIIFGNWNLEQRGTVDQVPSNHRYYINATAAHEQNKNWQYAATYAEEGKRKEVISYYDGSLRGRQMVTKINSDKNTIVGETIYDHQGRAAISVLPAPVSNPVCSGQEGQASLKYYPKFSRNMELEAYSRRDFDLSSINGEVTDCDLNLIGMHPSTGTTNYYSPQNPNQNGAQAYVPDATINDGNGGLTGFPFTQTEFTPDNTGRVNRQGGVGSDFQLNTGHETRYVYGQPNQLELDRAFGSEVGYAEHYTRNVVVDPNGQSSISYLDMQDRVIMTALAGEAPQNLIPLESNQGPVTLQIDAFGGSEQTPNELHNDDHSLRFTSQLTVPYDAHYQFHYDFTIAPYQDNTCLPDFCIDCVYDLTLELRDECGVNLFEPAVYKEITGKFTDDGNGNYSFHGACTGPQTPFSFGADYEVDLITGAYMLTKVLKVNEAAREAFIDLYMANANAECIKTYEEFLEEEMSQAEFTDCEITCENCFASLGTLEDFIKAEKGSEKDYYQRRDDCELLCAEQKSLCEIGFDMMMIDMTPGGQYAEYKDNNTGNFNADYYLLSILNMENLLPQNNATHIADWRHPLIKDALGNHYEYRDENGDRSIIEVNQDLSGNWIPAIIDDNTSLIQTNPITGQTFIYPEQLASAEEFKNQFIPSWARSLVVYHPEYCYYETCSALDVKVANSDPLSSEDFDLLIQNTGTFQDAIDAKLITASNQINWFAPDASDPTKPFDPFVYYNTTWNTPSCIDFGTQLSNQYTNYQEINGQYKSIPEVAVYLTLSSLQMNDPNVVLSYQFADLGTDPETLNLYWLKLRGLYSSVKLELLHKRADCIALHECDAFNNCFENKYFNPFAEGMLEPWNPWVIPNTYWNSEYRDPKQPCGVYTRTLYLNKTPRFAMEYRKTVEDAEYNFYIETGKCPVNFQFEKLLNALAVNDKLNETGVNLNTYTSFGNLLLAQNDQVAIADQPNLVYNGGILTDNPDRIDATWMDGSSEFASLILKKEEGSVAWDELEGITCLECGGLLDEQGHLQMIDENTPAGFRAKGFYYDEGGNQITVDIVGYFSNADFNLCNSCAADFDPVCEPNQLSVELTTTMNAMRASGQLLTSSPYPLADDFDYPTVRGAIGSYPAANQTYWSATSTGFRLTAQSFNQSVEIAYTGFEPATFNVSQFNQIVYFDNFQPTQTYGEFVQYATLSNMDRVKLTGTITRISALEPGGSSPVLIGDCYFPQEAQCSTTPHENYEHLKRFLKNALLSHNYSNGSGGDNPNSNPLELAEIHESILAAFPSYAQIRSEFEFKRFPNNNPTRYYNYLRYFGDINNNDKLEPNWECALRIFSRGATFPAALSFENLVDVSDFFLYKPADPTDSRVLITLIGTFEIDGSLYQDKIYVTSKCIDVNSCTAVSYDYDPDANSTGPGAEGDPDVLPSEGITFCDPDLTETEVNCQQPYLDYIEVSSLFNTWATENNYPYRLSIGMTFDLFVTDFCYCFSKTAYEALLEDIKTGVTPMASQAEFNYFTRLQRCGGTPEPPEENPCYIPVISPEVTPVNDCVEMMKAQAAFNARIRYEEYINALREELYNNYNQHCLAVTEHLEYNYPDRMYHYTLYYYDQAGNLIKTVPPEGVELLPLTNSSQPLALQIASDRQNKTKTVFTTHRMESRYEYNSLNQLVGQLVPDADAMDVFDVSLPNGLHPNLVTTQIQMITETRGYLSGYTPAITTLKIPVRGYLYQTNDAGATWSRVNNIVAADLRKVQMLTANEGFAAGAAGIVLKTRDGGNTWDMITTPWTGVASLGMVKDIYDFHFVKNGTNDYIGVFVGANKLIAELKYTINTTTHNFNLIQNGTTVLPANTPVTSVTADANNFYITANADAGGFIQGNVFSRPILTGTPTSWVQDVNFRPASLYDIHFAQGTIAYAVGVDGRIFRNADGSSTAANSPLWTEIPTSLTQAIRNIAFFSELDGVALVETAPGIKTLMRTADGGKNWWQLSEKQFNGLQFAPDRTVILAYGQFGALEIVLPGTLETQSIEVAFPTDATDPHHLTAAYVERIPVVNQNPKMQLSLATASGKFFTTLDAYQAIPSWIKTDLSATYGANPIVELEAKTQSNGTINGVVRLTDNSVKVYAQASNGTVALTTPGAYPATAPVIRSIALDGNIVYGWNNTNARPVWFVLNSNAAAINYQATATGSAYNIIGNDLSVAASNNKLMISNNIGNIIHATVNPSSGALTAESSKAWRARPTALYDIAIGNNTIVAAGADGTIYRRGSSGSNVVWEHFSTGFNQDIHALQYIGTNWYAAGQSGLVRSGTLSGAGIAVYNYNSTPLNLLNDDPAEEQISQTLNHLAEQGGRLYVAGNGGLMLYAADLNLDQHLEVMNLGDKDLYATSFRPGASTAIVVGDQVSVVDLTGKSYIYRKELFTPAIRDVNFADLNHGSIIADAFTWRVSHDGGSSWSIQRPNSAAQLTATDVNKVWTWNDELSLVFGRKLYVSSHNGNLSDLTASLGTLPVGNSELMMALDRDPNQNYLYMGIYEANNANRVHRLAITKSGTNYSYAHTPITQNFTFQIRALHVFANSSFATAHSGGKFNYYRNYTGTALAPAISQTIPNNPGPLLFTDMDFYDSGNGVLVTDKGLYYKTREFTLDANGYLSSIIFGRAAPAIPDMSELYLNDPYLQTATAPLGPITAVSFTDKNNLILGGSYAAGTVSNPQYCHVRNVFNPLSKYSSRFWYDRLGRLVVSQNTRQYFQASYSYTLYDGLGRVYQAGEKHENSASDQFKSIFGADVLGFFNPNTIDDTRLLAWINALDGNRNEVTQSYYDVAQITGLPADFVINPSTARKRIIHVTYELNYDGDDQTYDHATHYNYDIHGNVVNLIQDNRKMANDNPVLADQEFKRLDYQFDLISGNVHSVSAQNGKADQWHHAYRYDADNRITRVYTSKETRITSKYASTAALQAELVASRYWENDARYFYYAHGPLSRTELGRNNLQGLDYVYNLQGWMKGVNSTTLDKTRDPGQDAVSLGLHHSFAKDVFGFSLHYFESANGGDYRPISASRSGLFAFDASLSGSDAYNNSASLFNGNIRAMQTTITNPGTRETLPLVSAFRYDQLQRLKEARSFTNIDMNTNAWGSAGTYNNLYFNAFTFDANGNIEHQTRYGALDVGGQAKLIDDMDYHYDDRSGERLRNRLYHVSDGTSNARDNDYPDDINYMGPFRATDANLNQEINRDNNYIYDAEGRLIKDVAEGISNIVWRVDGKISAFVKTNGQKISFDYDAMGQRVAKHIYNGTVLEKSTYYLLDAQGNTMSVYEHTVATSSSSAAFTQVERHMYGSSRLGMDGSKTELMVAASITYQRTHEQGNKSYEMSEHRGNVMAVIQDKTIPMDEDHNLLVEERLVVILASSDYAPFGIILESRAFSSESYRYGYNGMELDNEIKGDHNSYDFGARMYDPRVGRWLSLDKHATNYPAVSPYTFALNSTLYCIDIDGNDVIIVDNGVSYNGTRNPRKASDLGVTSSSINFVYNETTAKYDLVLTVSISYSAAFNIAGANGKTLEEENPGIKESVKTHEEVHKEMTIKAVREEITHKTWLLNGEPRSFTGTADKVLNDILEIYGQERMAKRQDMVSAKLKELEEKYSPLLAEAGNDESKITEIKGKIINEKQNFIDTEIKNFDQKTNEELTKLVTEITKKVDKKIARYNVHEGENGIIKKTLRKLKSGSDAYKQQSGEVQTTWQGRILTN